MKNLFSALLTVLSIILLHINNHAFAATTCTATSSNLAFGNVAMGVAQTTTATINIQCDTFGLSLLANARVRMCLKIGAGATAGSTVNARKMSEPLLNLLAFQIYRDAGRSQIWGDTDANDVEIDLQYSVPLLGGSGSTSTILYGQVPAQLGLAAGNFQNTFTAGHTRLDYRYAERLLFTPSYPSSCISGGTGGGSITFPFTASATVPASCVIDTTNNLNFGSVSGIIDNNHDQTTNLNFTCTKTTPWKVSLNNGLHDSGITRRMRLGATSNYVAYELYRDNGYTLPWGNTLDVDTASGTGTGLSQNLTIYGRVPAPQSVTSGSYSDTVTVTITY